MYQDLRLLVHDVPRIDSSATMGSVSCGNISSTRVE